MELIKNLPPKLNKTGRKQSWAIFWCDGCSQEVERQLSNGLRAKSCGCQRYKLIFELNKGKKLPEETRQKISKTRIEKGLAKGTNNTQYGKKGIDSPNFGKKRTEEFKQNLKEFNTGKKVSKESRQKMREAKLGKYSGKNSPMYGKKRTEKSKRKQSESRKGKYCGENSPHWQNGKSFEIYPQEFKQIKKLILERDNHECQNPYCKHLSKILNVHHIDYDKKNSSPKNLVTLCNSCHTKTNGKNNRKYWIEYYQNIVINIL